MKWHADYHPRCHSHANAKDQGSVGQTLSERLSFAPFGIHMMRVEVAGLTGVHHDVGLGDGAAASFPVCAGFVIFKILFLKHLFLRSPRNSSIFFTERSFCK
jgi:hypothetical protein